MYVFPHCGIYLTPLRQIQVLTDIEDAGEVWVRGPTIMKVRLLETRLHLS